jgi:hypothetical protein
MTSSLHDVQHSMVTTRSMLNPKLALLLMGYSSMHCGSFISRRFKSTYWLSADDLVEADEITFNWQILINSDMAFLEQILGTEIEVQRKSAGEKIQRHDQMTKSQVC